MNLKPPSARQHGFRISIWDALVLALGFGLTWWLHSTDFLLWWVVPMALGHFFLFCNVLLVWRKLELAWAAVFIGNVMAHSAMGHIEAVWVLLSQMPVTLVVILLQLRSPWYHGIFASRWNPRLQEYLTGKI